MPKKSSVTAAERALLSVPAFWPMAVPTEMLEAGTHLVARNIKFIDEEVKIHANLRPTLATPNTVRLDLRTMSLREYGKPGGIPTLVDAPYAGHTAVIADYHDGQSLVQTLLANPAGGDAVRPISAVIAECRRSALRARHRSLPRDGPAVVEQVRADVRGRYSPPAGEPHAGLLPMAMAFR